MSYIESSEWDEVNEELEEYEEGAGESVLRNERELFISEWMNKGTSHRRLELNNII